MRIVPDSELLDLHPNAQRTVLVLQQIADLTDHTTTMPLDQFVPTAQEAKRLLDELVEHLPPNYVTALEAVRNIVKMVSEFDIGQISAVGGILGRVPLVIKNGVMPRLLELSAPDPH